MGVSRTFDVYFENTFSQEHLWVTTSELSLNFYYKRLSIAQNACIALMHPQKIIAFILIRVINTAAEYLFICLFHLLLKVVNSHLAFKYTNNNKKNQILYKKSVIITTAIAIITTTTIIMIKITTLVIIIMNNKNNDSNNNTNTNNKIVIIIVITKTVMIKIQKTDLR